MLRPSIQLRVGKHGGTATGRAIADVDAVMMAVARNIGDACQSIKAGKWERSRLVGVELKGKTLAIVGAGKGRS